VDVMRSDGWKVGRGNSTSKVTCSVSEAFAISSADKESRRPQILGIVDHTCKPYESTDHERGFSLNIISMSQRTLNDLNSLLLLPESKQTNT
jgi:hypothetical protein